MKLLFAILFVLMVTNINLFATRGCLYSSGYLYINENAVLWAGLPRFDWNSATTSGRVLGSAYCLTAIGTADNSCYIVNEFSFAVLGTLVDYNPLPCPIDDDGYLFFGVLSASFLAIRRNALKQIISQNNTFDFCAFNT